MKLALERITIAAAACTILPCLQPCVNAQLYPSRAIRVIVPYVPGGGTDFVGRTVAQKLADGLGSTVFVENRPGGEIGRAHV